MKLWLIRHAAVALPPGLCYGTTDAPALADATLAAAEAVAATLPRHVPLWVSGLTRAQIGTCRGVAVCADHPFGPLLRITILVPMPNMACFRGPCPAEHGCAVVLAPRAAYALSTGVCAAIGAGLGWESRDMTLSVSLSPKRFRQHPKARGAAGFSEEELQALQSAVAELG